MTYIFKSCYRNSSSHPQPPALGLFFLSSPYMQLCPFLLILTWWLPARWATLSPVPVCSLTSPPQIWCFGAPFQAQVSLLRAMSASGSRENGIDWTRAPGAWHDHSGKTLLLPPSPYSSQRLSQANYNLLFCYCPVQSSYMKKPFGQHCTLLICPEHTPGLWPMPSTGDLGHPPSSSTFFLIRGCTASCSPSLKGAGELSSMWLGHHPDLAGHCHHQPAHHWQLWVEPSATQTPAISKSHAEITLCFSLSYSYVLLSTPRTTVFCSTHQYYTRAFLAPCFCHRLALANNFFLL